MSQKSVCRSPSYKWNSKAKVTYDCPICLTTNTKQLLQLPCGHNLCLSCLHMICAHSLLACPFCRCRLSTWLRHNPDYSKLIIKRETSESKPKKQMLAEQGPTRRHPTVKYKPTLDEHGNISNDWLLAEKIHYEQIEEFRYTHGRVTRSMAKKVAMEL